LAYGDQPTKARPPECLMAQDSCGGGETGGSVGIVCESRVTGTSVL